MYDHAPYYLEYFTGDTLPLVYLEIENEDITGYGFEMVVSFADGTCLRKTGVVDNPNTGGVEQAGVAHFDWLPGDLDTVGIHPVIIKITDTLGRVETFSNMALRIKNA